MVSAIKFNGKLLGSAVEIENKLSYAVLTSELSSFKLVAFQQIPECSFRGGEPLSVMLASTFIFLTVMDL